jgi:hypothetical protein
MPPRKTADKPATEAVTVAAPTDSKEPKKARLQRPPPPAVADLPAAAAPLTRYEAFTPARVDRASVKDAPYNPRIIDRAARDRLEESLKKGLWQPIVWNRRTGNLVGGHQRLSVLDDLHGGKPYSITAAVIDVDSAEEKRINIELNSRDLMGDYDWARVEDMMRERAAEMPGADLERDFGLSWATLEQANVSPELYLPPEDSVEVVEVLEDEEKIKALKDVKADHKKKARLKAEREILRQIAFVLPDTKGMVEVRRQIMGKLGMPLDHGEPFVDAWRLLRALGIEVADEE